MPTSTRTLRDLHVAPLGLGCMGMNHGYGRGDRTESLATLHAAIDGGVTLLDTADMYANGANEQLVGEVLRTRRDEVSIATKFGILTDVDAKIVGLDGSPEYARKAVEASLGRLGVDTIDLYYLHRVDPTVPIEDTLGAMAEMVQRGQVRHLGISEASAETLRRAQAVHPISAVQSEWSIFSRDVEDTVVPAARELGIGLVPYSPLGRGLLTGAAAATTELDAGDFRRTLPRWQASNLEANLALVATVREIATAAGATPGQVALAWLLAQGADVVPIPGTKRRTYLAENLGANAVTLTADQLAALSALRPAGDRYPDMGWVRGQSPGA
ncbi:aldo/keto reductase [Pseudonocardia sp. MH-G8]|uniref:aldo/keto reductase n=1 Tax=Pseudonocardia sp. MH-G8 TaxID=1854588 RepID=UPI000BA11B93|nr:aldo/keto reductase [Pseudonocardia sp. MH-G8]OZM78547.1 aldo/keto reductase [Pseudonocardia sp. MH-G8]